MTNQVILPLDIYFTGSPRQHFNLYTRPRKGETGSDIPNTILRLFSKTRVDFICGALRFPRSRAIQGSAIR